MTTRKFLKTPWELPGSRSHQTGDSDVSIVRFALVKDVRPKAIHPTEGCDPEPPDHIGKMLANWKRH